MTTIKTLKDGRAFSIEIVDGTSFRYALGDEAGLTGSAPLPLKAKQGEWTHCIKLWVGNLTIGLTDTETAVVRNVLRITDAASAAALAKYNANPNKYQRFQGTADRSDRAYAASYDTDGEG